MSIIAEHLCKNFGPVCAVREVSCALGPGSVTGLLGLNGAGKTTLLRLFSTFLSPESGRALIAGHDCVTSGDRARRSLGYLPQSVPAAGQSRVAEYLEYRARLKEIPHRQRSVEIDRALRACDLAPFSRRLVSRLSFGLQRRVGLADALLGNPPVLLLDEPTAGLDPVQVVETRELLRGLADTQTILISTHLITEVESLCGRALILLRGRLAADLTLPEFPASSRIELEVRGPRSEIRSLLSQLTNQPIDSMQSLPGEWLRISTAADEQTRQAIVQECCSRNWNLRELRSLRPSLEEQFIRLHLTSREAA